MEGLSIKTVFDQAWAKILDQLLGTAKNQRLSILIYHRVLESEDYLRTGDPTVRVFNWQMSLLARYLHPLPLADALKKMDAGTLPDRAVCVTFDDGYADNADLALPVLKKWGIPATVFVSTGYLDGGRMWNDTVLETVRTSTSDFIDLSSMGLGVYPLGEPAVRKKSADDLLQKIKYLPPPQRRDAVALIAEKAGQLPDDLMLTTGKLKKLHDEGVEIGAHTHSHPILSKLSADEAQQEIATSKNRLEKLLGASVRYFAYPNGRLGSDYELVHKAMVCELGFEAALSTHWGVSDRGTDVWQLPRFTPWDSTPRRFLLRLLWNQRNLVKSHSQESGFV